MITKPREVLKRDDARLIITRLSWLAVRAGYYPASHRRPLCEGGCPTYL